MGQAGAVLVPLSLYWLAFTTYPHVHWIVPIIASIPFGTGISLCYTSTWTYLVTAYRPIAASSMAANTFVRTTFAAAFPLFAGQMYHRLGTVGATALLAGLTTISAPLPSVNTIIPATHKLIQSAGLSSTGLVDGCDETLVSRILQRHRSHIIAHHYNHKGYHQHHLHDHHYIRVSI